MRLIDVIRLETRLISRFTLIGIIATLVHMATSFVLMSWTPMTVHQANLGGFLLALCVSYSGHYYFSFKSAKAHKSALPRFFITTLTAYACNVLVIFVLTSWTTLPENICLLFGVGIMPFVSFILSRMWVY